MEETSRVKLGVREAEGSTRVTAARPQVKVGTGGRAGPGHVLS